MPVELGAGVHAFVRANSGGALNNIAHLRDRLKVHFADLTDRTSVDYLVRGYALRPTAPTCSTWARRRTSASRGTASYETIAANVLGTLEPPPGDRDYQGSSSRSSTPREPRRSTGDCAESVSEHHDFDDDEVILHERSPINPKSICWASVAADFSG